MKSEKLIHIKFEYDSALDCKKDILSSEIDLLRMSQKLENYHDLRNEELDLKVKVEKRLKALKLDIGRLQNLLPKIKIPKILKPESERKEEPVHKEVTRPKEDKIETELQEIQKRLSSLQR